MRVFMDADSPSMVLGVVFMRRYLSIFDRTDDRNPMIGFAPAAELEVDYLENEDVDRIPVNGDRDTTFG